MPWQRPTLQQINDRIEGDIKAGLGITTLLRRSLLKVLAKAYAGAVHLLHGHITYTSLQVFPDTAEVTFLDRWGAIYGILRKPATFAQFDITITGTNGTVIPANTTFKSVDGLEFTTDEEVTIAGGEAEVGVTASVSGQASNVEVGDFVNLLSPIAGANSSAEVITITIDAEDTEADEPYRARLLAHLRTPPSGGAAHDYIAWALSVAGITRAWVHPLHLGAGTVGVSVVEDAEDPISASAPKIQEVLDYINEVRPVTAEVNVFTPVLAPMDMVIKIKPNTVAVQEAIEAELKDLILRDSAVEGSYKTPSEENTGEILLSRINESISIAVGEEDHEIVTINGVAPADVVPGTNELIVLGTITWQPL